MLINEPAVMLGDPILSIIAKVNGNQDYATKIMDGVYQIGHYGSSHFLYEYEHYPELSVNAYGVCDGIVNLLEYCPELESSDRRFVVTLTPVFKRDQPSEGGWRWHKWGPYIGAYEPTCEYLYDEEDIDVVFVYHIYEKI